ncbi:hypothetical protein ABDK00_017045 [Niabella insulamsoli]|uniref:hypothetical protein n=1 Tax=Niabella insulamsoli TaxID=3144874 RepID=UPI0031FC8500
MKSFTIFRRPKNDDAFYSIPENNKVHDSFRSAVEAMNRVLRSQQRHELPSTLKQDPLIIELDREWMELWISDRPCFETDVNMIRHEPAGRDFRSERPVRMDDKIY